MTKSLVRGLIAAVSVASLAVPALADPWKDESGRGRGGGYKVEEKYDPRTGEYKYEEKGPGYKYEYKVDRHGRRVEEFKGRGAPPPWSRAHPRPDLVRADAVYVPPYGIDRGRCNRDLIGGAIGGAAGGYVGSRVGRGDGRVAATAAGAVIGVLVGGAIGRAMDRADHACVGQVLEHAPDGNRIIWSEDARGARYDVTPTETYRTPDGTYCREYRTSATIGGQPQRVFGTACRQPDGAWKLMS